MDAQQWMETLGTIKQSRLRLPMPPSVNHYWKWTGRGVVLTRRARDYRVAVQVAVLEQRLPKFTRPVVATIEIHPGHRACDLDNYEKSLWDALQHAGTLVNDSQVACVLRFWGLRKQAGGITLRIAEVMERHIIDCLPTWTDQAGKPDMKERSHVAKKRVQSRKVRKTRSSQNVVRFGIDQPHDDK